MHVNRLSLWLALGIAGAIGLGAIMLSPAAADVDPPMVETTLAPGESFHVVKTVDVAEVPPALDFCLLVDLSGSYVDDLPNIQALDDDIFDGLTTAVPDTQVCTASFVDYPIANYGDAASGDYAYQLAQDLTTTKATWTAANDALIVRSGGDGAESQYTGLHQISTGTGVDVTGNCPGFGAANVAAGQGASWRAGTTHVVGITTDDPFHVPGQTSVNCPAGGYPGPSEAATITQLGVENVKVIAIKAPGASTQMDDIATATGGSIVFTTSDSSDIVDAIIVGLTGLTFDITAQAVGCDPLNVTFSPDVHEDISGPTTVQFDEWIEVPAEATDQVIHCTVEFHADGAVIGVQELWITVAEPPVGGVAFDPGLAELALETGRSSGSNIGILVGVFAGISVVAITVTSAAWYAMRRVRR